MSGLLDSTLGAVGQVGEAIDKVTGGRAVRGTLAGKPRELASVIPFSDSMGLTDANDKTSGRDLTDAYGITGKGDNSFASHAAGFVADNVLSPGNMLGAYGAFKAAPTVAKGLTQGAKALSGLDIVDHVGRGVNAVGKTMGYLPAPHIPQYGKNADLVGAYDTLSKGFPKQIPLETYRPSSDLVASHLGAMPDQAGMQLEKANNARIESYKGSNRLAVPANHFDHQTTTPVMGNGTDSWNPNGARFSQPRPTTDPSALTARYDDLESQLAQIGWGSKELGGLGSKPNGALSKFFRSETGSAGFGVNHLADEQAAGSGLLSASLGRNPSVSSSIATESPWQKALRISHGAVSRFAHDESGYLKIPIPGVEPSVANAMDGLGPMYPGGRAKLKTLADSVMGNEEAKYRLGLMSRSPDGMGIANEIPEGSTFLGGGASSVALRTPEGGVVRIAHMPKVNRPDVSEMLQPVREARSGLYSIEHLPYVDKLDGQEARDASRALKGRLYDQGHHPWDVTDNNVGRTAEGNGIVFDGDAVFPDKAGSGSFGQRPVYDSPTGSALADAIAAGGPERVRESILAGLMAGTNGQGIPFPPQQVSAPDLATLFTGEASPSSPALSSLSSLFAGRRAGVPVGAAR